MLFFVLFWNILKFLWNMYSVRWKIAAAAKSANPCIAFIQKTRKNRILIDRSRTLNSVNKIIIHRICSTQNHCLTINPNCWLKKRDLAKKDYCSAYKLVLYSKERNTRFPFTFFPWWHFRMNSVISKLLRLFSPI